MKWGPSAAILSSVLALTAAGNAQDTPGPGNLLERVECPNGFEARVYATGLESPDGLAFDTKGRLCVVEESAGRVTRIESRGRHHVLADGLRSPEGICRGERGELYVVEDSANGRLVSISLRGEIAVLAEHLDAPEGVTLLGDTLYLTESTIQLVDELLATRTRLLGLRREKSSEKENGKENWSAPARVLERGLPLSFSELVADGPDHLILANETAGALIRYGLMRFELSTGELEVFATGLVSPEGLCWTPGETPGFPLYVAEEDIDGKGHGRVSQVDAGGQRTTFATGFGTLEDVLVGADGRIFVSEDSTGLVIELRPVE